MIPKCAIDEWLIRSGDRLEIHYSKSKHCWEKEKLWSKCRAIEQTDLNRPVGVDKQTIASISPSYWAAIFYCCNGAPVMRCNSSMSKVISCHLVIYHRPYQRIINVNRSPYRYAKISITIWPSCQICWAIHGKKRLAMRCSNLRR